MILRILATKVSLAISALLVAFAAGLIALVVGNIVANTAVYWFLNLIRK